MNQKGAFPATRMRRMRRDDFSRRLMRESSLGADDFIYPVFVLAGRGRTEAVASMPGVERMSLDKLLPVAERAARLGIPALALFPVVDAGKKSPGAEEAWNPEGLVPTVVAALKKEVPELGVITDVALDPYTSHGQDGLIDPADPTGYVMNDETVEALVKQALCHAGAGADVVAPSDMMDGRIGAVRRSLDAAGYEDTVVMSYAVKYASAFYGPFREAADCAPKFGDRAGYQMDPANTREALREVRLDIEEGADIVMVKPALAYLDVIRAVKEEVSVPVAAYNVSGEYAMLHAAAQNGWIDLHRAVRETLLSIRRAGADIIVTYHARDLAEAMA